jgi:glycosyltransferase involved in cell wall biosynthesis
MTPSPEPMSLRIAMIGTRGVPAAYGGFETAVEEIGSRLVDRGHEVTVFCRWADDPTIQKFRGMRLVHLPSVRKRSLETLAHTALSVRHVIRQAATDVAFVFNAANSPLLGPLQRRGIPVAVHVDGLEWRRAKWGAAGRTYYRLAESAAVRRADALIADAQGISDYYTAEFGARTELLAYGAPLRWADASDRLAAVGVREREFHLVVARLEPENHVHLIVEGYRRSGATLPLVVVGSAPYGKQYIQGITESASGDPRIRLLGSVWDQRLLDQLYANALTYLHGHSVGGTNPSLLRAMGAGAAVLAFDVGFNREVLGRAGRFFSTPDDVRRLIDEAEASPAVQRDLGSELRERAAERYNWDDVADGYDTLARRLAAGYRYTPRGSRRRHDPAWAHNRGRVTRHA